MVELKQKSKIIKGENKWVHNIKVTYPIENVERMKASWTKTIALCEEFLAHADENIEKAYLEGCQKLESDAAAIKKNIDEYLALSPEERAKKLLAEFQEQADKKLADLQRIDDIKKQLKESITSEMQKMKIDRQTEMEEKRKALEFWK